MPPNLSAGSMDAHYTPSTVAKLLIRAAQDLQPTLIADLAAGNGDLLFEAELQWPEAVFLATDIDTMAVRRLARLRPFWKVGRCDLRNARSRASSRPLRSLSNSVSLMLLNPPFSCRGGSRHAVRTPAGLLQASTALCFLLLASRYVAPLGHIVSVLPANSLHSQKDLDAWRYLRTIYNVIILQNCATGTFPGSTASTMLIRLSPRDNHASTSSASTVASRTPSGSPVTVIRGTCPIHRPRHEHGKPPLIHYTDIRDGVVHLNGRRGFGQYRCIPGPAILLPRVGRITPGKLAILKPEQVVMLSDCVIALKPRFPRQVESLRQELLANFAQLQNHFLGTGAPFITLDRLKSFLTTLGVPVNEHV